MAGCFTNSIRSIIRGFNFFLIALGLTLLIYGVVLVSDSRNAFCIGVLVLGAVFIGVGLLGALAVVRGKHKVVLYVYDALLIGLALFQAFVVIGLFAAEGKTVDLFVRLDDDAVDGESNGAQIDKLKSAVNANPTAWKMALLVILAIELCGIAFQFCFHSRLLQSAEEREFGLDDSLLPSSLPADVGMDDSLNKPSKTPKTDATRDRLREKYGDRFDKKPRGSKADERDERSLEAQGRGSGQMFAARADRNNVGIEIG